MQQISLASRVHLEKLPATKSPPSALNSSIFLSMVSSCARSIGCTQHTDLLRMENLLVAECGTLLRRVRCTNNHASHT